MTGTPDDTSEVTIRWQGKLLPSGKVFRPTKTQTFKLDEDGLRYQAPWWKHALMGNPGGAQGGRGMGEGEVAQFTVPPECGFGDTGDPKSGVPPGTTLLLKVSVLQTRVYSTKYAPRTRSCTSAVYHALIRCAICSMQVTLLNYATFEDISPHKDGSCIRKVERRGASSFG